MKRITKILLVVILVTVSAQGFSQTINWAGLRTEQRHIIHLYTGWDYGLVYGAGYSYQLKSKRPVLLNLVYSFPSGEKISDDFKTKIGGQFRIYQINNFQLSVSLHGIYRRYENPLVRLQNFGSEMTFTPGYYKPRWFAAVELGFDKAILTHFKHSKSFKEILFDPVVDGWYEPATGGHFKYGLQTGYSFKRSDFILSIGKVITQDFKTTPLIPYYLQLGFNYKI